MPSLQPVDDHRGDERRVVLAARLGLDERRADDRLVRRLSAVGRTRTRQAERVGLGVELLHDLLQDLVLGLVGADEVRVGPRETLERVHAVRARSSSAPCSIDDLEEPFRALAFELADPLGDLRDREAGR